VSWLPSPAVAGATLAARTSAPSVQVTAGETANLVAGVYRVSSAAALPFDAQTAIVRQLNGERGPGPKRVLTLRGSVRAFFKRNFVFPRKPRLAPGLYVIGAVLRAETSSGRQTSFVSTPFQVGT
jgi:hypothetical protein